MPPATDPQQLSVAEVRRALASMRRGWEEVCSDPRKRPFYLSDSMNLTSSPGLSIEAFALHFVLSHHTKRGVRTEEAPEA